MEDSKKIQSFENLIVWQESQLLAVSIYKITKQFPNDELFGITSQIRRSASSVSANIAEGFGRKTTKDKLHFYVIAYGSLLETKNFLYLSEKLQFMSLQDLESILDNVIRCQKLLNAFMRPLRA